MINPPSRFLVAVCQLGAERALKQEVTRAHPDLHAAFARPGLVTWKSVGAEVGPAFALRSVFARAHAAALGPARGVEEVVALAAKLRGIGSSLLHLHVWERDAFKPGDEPASSGNEARAVEVRAALLASGGALFTDAGVRRTGDHVLDVIVAGEEPFFIGHHLHSPLHSPFAGGRIHVEVPKEAPSRAYRKVEEALVWSGAELAAGQVAVEIGSAPGGASYALLRRGLEVVGIDPGAMSPLVLAMPRFRHVARAVAEVRPEDLPARADWLLLDVNLAPQVALHSVRGIVSALRPSLRGVLFTLKLNDWEMAARVPALLGRMEEMGLTQIRATQLPSNRQEIFAYGVPKGVTKTRSQKGVTKTRGPKGVTKASGKRLFSRKRRGDGA